MPDTINKRTKFSITPRTPKGKKEESSVGAAAVCIIALRKSDACPI